MICIMVEFMFQYSSVPFKPSQMGLHMRTLSTPITEAVTPNWGGMSFRSGRCSAWAHALVHGFLYPHTRWYWSTLYGELFWPCIHCGRVHSIVCINWKVPINTGRRWGEQWVPNVWFMSESSIKVLKTSQSMTMACQTMKDGGTINENFH